MNDFHEFSSQVQVMVRKFPQLLQNGQLQEFAHVFKGILELALNEGQGFLLIDLEK